MKRSDVNALVRSATACFAVHGWALPPRPRWDVTDFGLGDWNRHGLVLVNLTEQPEYCEKLMYARQGMTTPCHCHHRKKEDIICRWGALRVWLWAGPPEASTGPPLTPEVVLGEVSTYNDDAHDNVFADPRVGRMPAIDEDEPPVVRLVWETA